jgi:hypothetical protein
VKCTKADQKPLLVHNERTNLSPRLPNFSNGVSDGSDQVKIVTTLAAPEAAQHTVPEPTESPSDPGTSELPSLVVHGVAQ